MFGVMRDVVERYGYEEYDAPILESIDLYQAKTSDEVVNEQTYSFMDRGDRQMVIRPEMTPSVSRMVAARRQELSYPLRWYAIPNLWRYERPQRGRLREHWQLNVDLFGVPGLEAEHEIIQVADDIMQAYGAKRDMYVIKLNSRKLINEFLRDGLGLDESQTPTLIRLIDRMHKIEQADFIDQADAVFTPSQRESGCGDKLINFLKSNDVEELPEALKSHESVKQIQDLMKLLKQTKVTNVEFDPTLMRGFDYYTDIVFEVFDKDPENNRSMFGGGRYDGLVAAFGVEPVPTIGFGMGDVTLQNFLEAHGLSPDLKAETDLHVVLLDEVYEKIQHVLGELRNAGINVSVDSSGRKADKQLKSADKKGVHYVMFIGNKDLEQQQFVLKNLETSEEERHSLVQIISLVQDSRKQ